MKTFRIRWLAAVVAVLLLVTGVLVAVNHNKRDKAPEGSIVLNVHGQQNYLVLDEIDHTDITGTVTDEKGESVEIAGRGVYLSTLLDEIEFKTVTLVAENTDTAVLSEDEIENAVLLVDGETIILHVLGDKNAVRTIEGVKEINVR